MAKGPPPISDDTTRYREQFNILSKDADEDFEWFVDIGNKGVVDPGEIKLPQNKAGKYGLTQEAFKAETVWKISPTLFRKIEEIRNALEIKRRMSVKKALGPQYLVPYVTEFAVAQLSIPSRTAIPHFLKISQLTDELEMLMRDTRMLEFREAIEEQAKQGYTDSLTLFERQAELGCSTYIDDPVCELLPTLPTIDPNTLMWPDNFTEEEVGKLDHSNLPNQNELLSYFTVVEKEADGSLKATPYNEHPLLKERLLQIAEEFEKIANIKGIHESIQLTASAYVKAIREGKASQQNRYNPYAEAEKIWATQFGGDLAFTWGPLEETDPFDRKRGFEFLLFHPRSDKMDQMTLYQQGLQDLENAAAKKIPGYRPRPMKVDSTIHVSDVLMRSGQMHHAGGEYLAHVLPIDGPLVEGGRPRREIFANIHEAKGALIMKRLAELAMDSTQSGLFDLDFFVINSATHEMSHTAGPREDHEITLLNREVKTAKELIGNDDYNSLEESKANIGGIYLYHFLQQRRLITPQEAHRAYFTYVVNLLRQVRFAKNSPHGRGAKGELGYLFEKKAVEIVLIPVNKELEERVHVNLDKMEEAVESMYVTITTAQQRGSREKAQGFLNKAEKIPEELLQDGPFDKRYANANPPLPRDVTLQVVFK